MRKKENNFAFVDGQNVNLGIQKLGWKLDWKKFRVYLGEKYSVTTAYLFIGFIEENQDLYKALEESGFVLVFRDLMEYRDGTVKGNCDAELVLQAMIDYKKYAKAVIVTGDGDFACLVKHLNKAGKLKRVLAPNIKEYSALLKRVAEKHLDFMSSLRKKLEYKPKNHRKRESKRVTAKTKQNTAEKRSGRKQPRRKLSSRKSSSRKRPSQKRPIRKPSNRKRSSPIRYMKRRVKKRTP